MSRDERFHSRGGSSRTLPRVLLVTSVLLAVACSVGPARSPAAPEAVTGPVSPVTVDLGPVSLPVDGAFTIKVSVEVNEPATYFESRVQIRRPAGSLLYQKTEVRSDLATGTIDIAYARELADLDLSPGIYPVQVRVRTDTGTVNEWIVEDRLLLHDPSDTPTPLAMIVKIAATPATDANGRFVVEPSATSHVRQQAEEVASLVIDNPGARLTLAIPPLLLEEWLKASQGYSVARDDGAAEVPADDPIALAHANTLELLKRALATGRLELLTVPYAEPDIGALARTDRTIDLGDHYMRAVSGYLATLETTPVAGTALPGDTLPASARALLTERGISFAALHPRSLASFEATPSSGTYRADGLDVLLIDTDASAAIEAGDPDLMVERLFARHVSDEASAPLIVAVDLGPGRPARASTVTEVARMLRSARWTQPVTASDCTRDEPPATLELTASVSPGPGAPPGYWEEVADARRYSSAFLNAVGVNDPDAQAANDASLISQSSLWSGPDGSWAMADRGRAFAAAAKRSSAAVLDSIGISAPDITLSSTTGEVPVSVTNGSDKNLELTIYAQGDGILLPEPRQTVRIRPQENFVTVPVDLQSSLSGNLRVQILADDVLLAETASQVHASYLDRLVVVGGVAVVLVGILLFIRHRLRESPRAGTITEQEDV